MQRRRRIIAAFMLAVCSSVVCASVPAVAQSPAESAEATPGCNLGGSPNVFAEGRSMLRLGDVHGCKDVRWEIIPGLTINGQPAVRILPNEECPGGARGADGVFANGAPVSRQGDACG